MRALNGLLVSLLLLAPSAAQADDTTQQLVQRFTGPGQVLIGTLPADLQALLPLPVGVQVLATLNPAGWAARADQAQIGELPRRSRILLSGPPLTFRSSDALLRGAGWLPFPHLDPNNPFQATADLHNGRYYHREHNLALTLQGPQGRGGDLLAYVDMDVHHDPNLAEQYAAVVRARQASPLPTLAAPIHLLVTPEQQVRTTFGAVYSVTVTGTTSVEALHEHYAAPLQAAGWAVQHTQLDGSSNRSSIWLTGAVNGPVRTATLMVAAVPGRPETFVVALGYFGPV